MGKGHGPSMQDGIGPLAFCCRQKGRKGAMRQESWREKAAVKVAPWPGSFCTEFSPDGDGRRRGRWAICRVMAVFLAMVTHLGDGQMSFSARSFTEPPLEALLGAWPAEAMWHLRR